MNTTAPITLAQAKAIAKAHSFSLRHKDGEYRVNLLGGNEDSAYYTTDRIDAVETGVAMREYASFPSDASERNAERRAMGIQ